MNYNEIVNHCANEAKRYDADEYSRYLSEMGWEDWMNDFVIEDDDKVASEAEIRAIEKVQREGWELTHGKEVA
jgi:hypothetical protein